MAVQLIGAKGNRIVEVTDEGRLHTNAVIETDMEKLNETGFAWCLPFDAIDPTGADDIFVYLQNTEPSMDLHIRRIRVSSTVAGMLEVLRVTGTATGGDTATLLNFNDGFSSKTPTGIFETGVDITALADGGKYAFQQLPVADTTYDIHIPHDIILNKNGAMALNWVPATGILSGTVWFFLHE
jgi:hypothetical protein